MQGARILAIVALVAAVACSGSGAVGPQGAEGPAGPQGQQGPPGSNGSPGSDTGSTVTQSPYDGIWDMQEITSERLMSAFPPNGTIDLAVGDTGEVVIDNNLIYMFLYGSYSEEDLMMYTVQPNGQWDLWDLAGQGTNFAGGYIDIAQVQLADGNQTLNVTWANVAGPIVVGPLGGIGSGSFVFAGAIENGLAKVLERAKAHHLAIPSNLARLATLHR